MDMHATDLVGIKHYSSFVSIQLSALEATYYPFDSPNTKQVI
jgi:hypothetical protein